MTLAIPFTSRREKTKRRKHRADDRITELKDQHAAELARLRAEMGLLREENIRLLNQQARADDYFAILWNDVLVTNKALVVKEGLRQEAEVAAAQMRMQRDEHAEAIARIDERHGETVRELEAQIAELKRRLDVGVLAESVVTTTQELSLEQIRQHCVMPLQQAPFATTGPGWAPPAPAVKDDRATN